jgi:CubicO group peptidase (beta-lactamase class C family)
VQELPLDGFSGVISIGGEAKAYGYAHRAYEVPNTVETRFAIASGAKSFTALAVVSLIVDGRLDLDTPARAVLGNDLPLIAGDVTIEHLLSHRSGIGDYFDEDAGGDIDDYVMPVPVHRLATTEDYLAVLDGWPAKFAAGERFSYCNSGFVVLALIAERAAGTPFHELVDERVCVPAGLTDTAFDRSDSLPGRTATGYLADGRTNVLHLPVRGTGDGGIATTVADVERFWRAFRAGEIVPPSWVEEMQRPRSEHYGLGFWLHPSGVPVLEGSDAGVSFRSVEGVYTVVSNTSTGAWPVCRAFEDGLA